MKTMLAGYLWVGTVMKAVTAFDNEPSETCRTQKPVPGSSQEQTGRTDKGSNFFRLTIL